MSRLGTRRLASPFGSVMSTTMSRMPSAICTAWSSFRMFPDKVVTRLPGATAPPMSAPATNPMPPITAYTTTKIDWKIENVGIEDHRRSLERDEHTADGGDPGGEPERVELGAEHSDAERGGGALVGSHRDEPTSGAAPPQVCHERARARRTRGMRTARTAPGTRRHRC